MKRALTLPSPAAAGEARRFGSRGAGAFSRLRHGRRADQAGRWWPLPTAVAPNGWLAIVAFALAAEGVAGSVRAAKWQPGLGGLPVLVAIAIVTALAVSKAPAPRARWHSFAIMGGCLCSVKFVAGSFLPAGTSFISQTGMVLKELVDWIDLSIMVAIYQDNMLIALAVASYLFAWTYLAFLVALHWRRGWAASTMLGLAILSNVDFRAGAAKPYLTIWALGCLMLNLQLALAKQATLRRLRFGDWRSGERLMLAAGASMVILATVTFAFAPPVPTSRMLNDVWNRIDGPLVWGKQTYDQIGLVPGSGAGQVHRVGLGIGETPASHRVSRQDLPPSPVEAPADLPLPQPVTPSSESEPQRHFPWAISLVAPAAGAALWFALTSRGSPITAELAYARLAFLGRLLGLRPRRWQTPREFGDELQKRRRFRAPDTDAVTVLYSAARYGRRPLESAEHDRAWHAWQHIRGQFFRFWERR